MGAFVTAGGELKLKPGQPVYTPAIGSPVSISAPAGREPPIVVDFAPVYDLRISPRWPELAEWIPGTIFRCIGLGMIAQAWGGIMAGTASAAGREHPRRYPRHRPVRVRLHVPGGPVHRPGRVRARDGRARRAAAGAAPLEGFEQASYAGGIEGERELEFRAHGIPVGPEHRRDLEAIAAEFGADVPWARGG